MSIGVHQDQYFKTGPELDLTECENKIWPEVLAGTDLLIKLYLVM